MALRTASSKLHIMTVGRSNPFSSRKGKSWLCLRAKWRWYNRSFSYTSSHSFLINFFLPRSSSMRETTFSITSFSAINVRIGCPSGRFSMERSFKMPSKRRRISSIRSCISWSSTPSSFNCCSPYANSSGDTESKRERSSCRAWSNVNSPVIYARLIRTISLHLASSTLNISARTIVRPPYNTGSFTIEKFYHFYGLSICLIICIVHCKYNEFSNQYFRLA